MKQTQFKVEGYKKIICPNCGYVNGEMHLGEKNIRTVTCKRCKALFDYFPPVKIKIDGVNKIQYGPGNTTFTADQTQTEQT